MLFSLQEEPGALQTFAANILLGTREVLFLEAGYAHFPGGVGISLWRI